MTKYIIGASCGIVIAIILSIILKLTIFRDKNITILSVLMIVLFGITGGVIQSKLNIVNADAPLGAPTPQEQIEILDNEISDGWKNINGGFTFDQISQSQQDEDCPYYDDQIVDLKCYDFGSYVVFSYKKQNNVFENALFYKSNNGLIVDGVMNMSASVEGIDWFMKYKLSTFKWLDGRNKEPNYTVTTSSFPYLYSADNMVSLSRQTADFVQFSHKLLMTNESELTSVALRNASSFTGKNIVDKFIKFGDVELVGSGNSGLIHINSFYNYLYEQIKGQDYNTTKLVDASTLMCLPIPSALQSSYLIPESKRANYDNAENYCVYKCDIAINLNFVKGNQTQNATVKNESYIEKLQKDESTKDKIAVEQVESGYSFTKVVLGFSQTNTSDLSDLNLSENPIKIVFKSSELGLSKTIVINSVDTLKNGTNILLNSNTTWTYSIDSALVSFDYFIGSFSLKESTSSITFKYIYLDGKIACFVGLNPVGTIDYTSIDLANNPVKIVIYNDDTSVEFVFDDNSKLNETVNYSFLAGKYSYTILSNQLIFATYEGTLEFSTTDRTQLFNYTFTGADTSESYDIVYYINEREKYYEGTTEVRYSDSIGFYCYPDDISDYLDFRPCFRYRLYDSNGLLIQSCNITYGVGYIFEHLKITGLEMGDSYVVSFDIVDSYSNPTVNISLPSYDFVYEDGLYFCYNLFLKSK